MSRTSRVSRSIFAALLLATALGWSAQKTLAQQPRERPRSEGGGGSDTVPSAVSSAPTADPTLPKVLLTAGRSTVLQTDFAITRIAVTDPKIADATVVAPREILIDGKAPGTISLIVWGAGNRLQYDLVVQPTVSNLQQQLQALFPGENIEARLTDEAIVLAGNVSSNTVMLRAGE